MSAPVPPVRVLRGIYSQPGPVSTPMTVLVNAGPWLAVPPRDYGGIEAVVAALVPELRRRGVRVVLATVAESTAPADRYVTVFERGQFDHIAGPYNLMMGIAQAASPAPGRSPADMST